MMTERNVAIRAMPIELISARVKSGWPKTSVNCRTSMWWAGIGALPDTMSDAGLKASMIIHSSGKKL
jgi:hypothetical protein